MTFTKSAWVQQWAMERMHLKRMCDHHKSQRCLHSGNDKACVACGDKAWAVKKVSEKLSALSPEEFNKKLEESKNGDIYKILVESKAVCLEMGDE